ncbi:hypothetical protein M0R45_018003 [Rubus argutus]|uniref:Uncharacterized protein n=1 Tax=Rubus argutus TaxID=59490 RepID=A0AAW1XZR1_RUBAR
MLALASGRKPVLCLQSQMPLLLLNKYAGGQVDWRGKVDGAVKGSDGAVHVNDAFVQGNDAAVQGATSVRF